LIHEKGLIIAFLTRDWVKVKVRKGSAGCKSCAAASWCHPSGETAYLEIIAVNSIGADIGQEVLLEVPTKTYLKASFLVYMLPILGLLVGAGLGEWLSQLYLVEEKSSWLQMGLGLSAFLATYGGVYFYNRFLRSRDRQDQYMPQVISIESL